MITPCDWPSPDLADSPSSCREPSLLPSGGVQKSSLLVEQDGNDDADDEDHG